MCISNDTSVKVYIPYINEMEVLGRIESVKAVRVFLYCMFLPCIRQKPEHISLFVLIVSGCTIQFTVMNFKNQTYLSYSFHYWIFSGNKKKKGWEIAVLGHKTRGCRQGGGVGRQHIYYLHNLP